MALTGIPLLSSKKSYPLNTLHNESTTPLSHQGNMYSGRDLGYSLSDSNLPDRRSKRDLVVDWLDQQTFVAPETAESPESILLAQGCLNIGHGNDPLQQLLPAQYYQQQQQQQQQQLTLSHQLGFAAQLDPNQLYLQQHSINNTGAQREPRQEHHRSIQRSNDLYPGSRTPPCVHDDFDQQNPSHRRSLSLNNPGGRGGARSRPQSQVYRKATPARFENLSLAEQARQEHQMRRQHYQQQYYQHRQQHQHQHQHQLYQHQHQLYQHQQYYQAPGSRPESMYSNAPAAPRIHTMGSTLPRENQFVPPRQYHQQPYPRPHPPTQQQQHRHNSDLHHSSVSSPKGSSVSRSAHDLAWERHCYYQQQQIQEDALAERRRIEQQQQQRKAQRPLSSVEGLQVPLLQGSSSVMRTSSMSRISNSSTTAVAGGKMSSSLGRLAGGEMVAHQNSSSGLSRSVSTSAIMDAKHRAAKKDKTTSGSSGANLKKSNIKESLADENEAKSTSMFDECKFLRLLRRSDSKLSKMNTEKPSASTQAHSIGTSSEERLKVPVVITTQPLGSTPSPSATAAATPGLNRRRTLKDLAPSIRSLARRCSSRFSSNSSRPNSFAGSSSDPVIQLSEEKGGPRATSGGVRGSHSLSMTTSYLPLKLSLSSLPRSLTPGPDGVVDLQHAAGSDDHQSMPSSPLSVKYFPLTSTSTSFVSLVDKPASPPLVSTPDKEQGIPIHRKVTLFRSKTMSLAKSSPPSSSRDKTTPATLTSDTIDTTPSDSTNSMADDDDNANTKNSSRANSLPSRRRPQRDSLRLANGHGLDFNTFLPPISVTTSFSTISAGTTSSVAADDEQASAVERSTNNLESALPARSSLDPAPVAIVTSSRLSDMDQQQKARRQIISLLAMGRKDRISAKTGHVMKNGTSSSSQPSTPTTGSSPTTPVSQLTPLALEAQEDLFVTRTASEVAGGQKDKQGEEDPVERIAFMLVPKSRYEFQPLVVA
ncbi:hypothetical protein EC991_006113 [Linnemannia zychae]|nr:hypothetical protein EC991_006113 [Linnemannia zychae]